LFISLLYALISLAGFGRRHANASRLVIATAASWFILGIWFGLGYCPVRDWQWQVKARLGERNLPASFIEYYAERITGYNFSTSFIDITTLVSFY
jgi:hypothetical protein